MVFLLLLLLLLLKFNFLMEEPFLSLLIVRCSWVGDVLLFLPVRRKMGFFGVSEVVCLFSLKKLRLSFIIVVLLTNFVLVSSCFHNSAES